MKYRVTSIFKHPLVETAEVKHPVVESSIGFGDAVNLALGHDYIRVDSQAHDSAGEGSWIITGTLHGRVKYILLVEELMS